MNAITKANLVYVIQLALIFVVGVICWQVLQAAPQAENPTTKDGATMDSEPAAMPERLITFQYTDAVPMCKHRSFMSCAVYHDGGECEGGCNMCLECGKKF